MQDYDDYIINGSWHKCVCGARWSDSDGGPCCYECEICGAIVNVDDQPEEPYDEMCKECRDKRIEEENEYEAPDFEPRDFHDPELFVD